MAVVQVADIIQPEYFAEYMANNSMVSTALFQSGDEQTPPSQLDPDDALFPAIVEILSTPLRPDQSNVPPAAPCESADYS